MKTASSAIQILALSACFLAQAHGAFTMPGVRRALQTMAAVSVQISEPGEQATATFA